jgi:hypothetical protein
VVARPVVAFVVVVVVLEVGSKPEVALALVVGHEGAVVSHAHT